MFSNIILNQLCCQKTIQRIVNQTFTLILFRDVLFNHFCHKNMPNKHFSDSFQIVLSQNMPKKHWTFWGWSSLNALWRPVPGELTVATGVPGHGKSEFLLSLAAAGKILAPMFLAIFVDFKKRSPAKVSCHMVFFGDVFFFFDLLGQFFLNL